MMPGIMPPPWGSRPAAPPSSSLRLKRLQTFDSKKALNQPAVYSNATFVMLSGFSVREASPESSCACNCSFRRSGNQFKEMKRGAGTRKTANPDGYLIHIDGSGRVVHTPTPQKTEAEKKAAVDAEMQELTALSGLLVKKEAEDNP